MNTRRLALLSFILALGVAAIPSPAVGATFVSGDIWGTLDKASSPYIATGNLSVPKGQSLSISPGVSLIMGSGLKLNVAGQILALGTAAEPIRIKGANSTSYWDTVSVSYGSGKESKFSNCVFTDATNGVSLQISGMYNGSGSMSPEVSNCGFSNCLNACISGAASMTGGQRMSTVYLNGRFMNNLFRGSSVGVYFFFNGTPSDGSQGGVNSTVANNVFVDTGTAIWLDSGGVGNANVKSSPQLVNNVFVQNVTAVLRTGSLNMFNSDVAAYNCCFGNQNTFMGYPAGVHGTVCCQNNNATPCDLLFNIFVDPLFAETVSYTLATNSPCIDAGDPTGPYLDCNFPPSLGSTTSDIGLQGGPYTTGFLTNAVTTFSLKADKYVGVTITPGAAGRYRLDYTENLALGQWTQVTNLMLFSTPYTYFDVNSLVNPKRFYRAVLLP